MVAWCHALMVVRANTTHGGARAYVFSHLRVVNALPFKAPLTLPLAWRPFSVPPWSLCPCPPSVWPRSPLLPPRPVAGAAWLTFWPPNKEVGRLEWPAAEQRTPNTATACTSSAVPTRERAHWRLSRGVAGPGACTLSPRLAMGWGAGYRGGRDF